MTAPAGRSAEDRLTLAVSAAKEAGAATLQWFRTSSLEVHRKDDGSPVTAADRAAESLLRDQISAAFPDDSILGEEFGEKRGVSNYRWVLDPIDGTKSFITGVPLYTTLVAVMEGDRPLLGVIYAPATGEIVYAAAGEGAWYAKDEGEPVAAGLAGGAAERGDLCHHGTGRLQPRGKERGRHVFDQLESACRLTRTWGDAYGYLLVATGRADVMVDPVVNLWDAACLQPIIEGAGGHFSDWQGRPTVHTGNAVASNRQLAGLVLSITRDA